MNRAERRRKVKDRRFTKKGHTVVKYLNQKQEVEFMPTRVNSGLHKIAKQNAIQYKRINRSQNKV